MSIESRNWWKRIGGLVLSLMIGCGDAGRNQPDVGAQPGGGSAEVTISSEDPTPAAERIVLFVGTSLTAGYGLPPEQAYTVSIQERIEQAGLPFRSVNAGISGETSAGALARIDWLLQQPFDVLVLETGGNDMLRGTDPESTERNIQTIIDRVRERRPEARILLAGMLAMPNLGREYGERFEAIYPRIAERNGLVLIPFLLEGVAGDGRLNLADGIHPNAEGQRIVAETVWEVLEPVLREEARE
jgi:acyl-CoA thioesterase I